MYYIHLEIIILSQNEEAERPNNSFVLLVSGTSTFWFQTQGPFPEAHSLNPADNRCAVISGVKRSSSAHQNTTGVPLQ